MEPQITQISQIPEDKDRSGHGIDIWGDRPTTPILIPRPGQFCVNHDHHGRCPEGCRECADFADQMGITFEQFAF